MADFSEITINTTAQKIERMANMEINNETIDDTSDDNSLPTSKLVYDFVSNSVSGVNGDFVSYSQSQDLTDEQKEMARNNINATDEQDYWNLLDVVQENTVVFGEEIVSLKNRATTLENETAELEEQLEGGVSYLESQELTSDQKETARNNIGAVDASRIDTNGENVSVNNIPTYDGIRRFAYTNEGAAFFPFVSCFNKQPHLSNEQEQIARENIGAVSKDELDSTIGNINSILATVVSGVSE